LTAFKSKLSSGGDVFGPLIHKYLLDNKHRSGRVCVWGGVLCCVWGGGLFGRHASTWAGGRGGGDGVTTSTP